MASQKQGRTVLVVDDVDLQRKLIRTYLEAEGYTVFGARNAEECLHTLNGVKPSVILLDVQMPGSDGYELCLEIEERYPDLRAPIIFVTAQKTPEDVRLAKQVGADYFLVKPFTPDQLYDAIRKAFVLKAKRR